VSNQPAISISNLNKTYRPKSGGEKVAIKDISLDIPQGSFFGLLGPNGAGKSTIINILAGLVSKTSGTVSVCGFDLDKDPRNVKYNLGVVPQELILDPFFSVREALEFHAGYYGVPKSKRRTDEIMKALHLEDKAQTNSRRLSGGMRRRLLIGKALVHNPKVLILDEPTAGVDIELRQSLWKYVRELNENGTTIVLTTHYLEEADELCDKVAIINHGKIVAYDSKENLLKNLENKFMLIKLSGKIDRIPDSLSQYKMKIIDGNSIEVHFNPAEVMVGKIMKDVIESGLNITDLVSEDAKLEDLFLQITSVA
jgi:ABC-2 type transport system ATP-binding protein